jgi:hypothetical protein
MIHRPRQMIITLWQDQYSHNYLTFASLYLTSPSPI